MGSVDRKATTTQLLNRLRMRQVALLLAIHEEHTLHRAADRLGMSQPAATKMLSELEKTLGFRLFMRVHRGLEMNAQGRRVLEYFQSLRGTMESLNHELTELRQGSAGRLAIGSIMAASPGRLTQALLMLKTRYPLLSLEVAVDTSDRLLSQLREGVLEVVIGRVTAHNDGDYQFRPIEDESLCIVSSTNHPLAGDRRVRLQSLHDFGWILQSVGSPMRAVMEQEFHENGLSLPRGLIETGSMLTTINLIRHSELVSVLPSTVASYHDQHGILRILPYRIKRSLESYGSIIRSDRPLSTQAQTFMDIIHQAHGERAARRAAKVHPRLSEPESIR